MQLIDASQWFKPLRKNLGKKNCELAPDDIARITQTFLDFKETHESKLFPNAGLGYWKVTVERPLRLHSQLSLKAIAALRFASGDEDLRSALFDEFDNALFIQFDRVAAAVEKRLSEWGADDAEEDSDAFEFLALSSDHSELDLHRSLVQNLGRFLTELGRDFCYIGSEYPVQVGNQAFALDLLFFHRGLNCLVAIELKVTAFEPEHFGKLNFYLEALDRDHRKPHENPAIGVLLCASKDSEVVEYALSRTLSPAMVAEYQAQLPDKKCWPPSCTSFMRSTWRRQNQNRMPSRRQSGPPGAPPRPKNHDA